MDFTAKWITGPAKIDRDSEVAPYLFRKQVTLPANVKSAVLYATALGVYSIFADNHKISDTYFAPGYTEYSQRLQYQEYDVTSLLSGKSSFVLTAELADGWYAGRLGLCNMENRYGEKRALLAELHVTLTDGSEQIIPTDTSFEVTTEGPRRHAGFFDGEVYDARLENKIPADSFVPASEYTGKVPPQIVPMQGVPVRLHEQVKPKRIFKDRDGITLIDFGRNLAGIVKIGPLTAKEGQQIVIHHGELVQDGKLYTGNLRTAKQTLVYTCKEGVNEYLPEFCYMGFQYISVEGMDVTEENICAYEIYSDMETIGSFTCSDERINQLQHNIVTSLKANFIDIPTDCPQRDERCGWTGDIAAFAPTAAFNMDITQFMKKWLGDLAIVQKEVGVVPWICPSNNFIYDRTSTFWAEIYDQCDALWGDAATLVPWAVYQSSGDVSVLEQQYESMKSWVNTEKRLADIVEEDSPRYIWKHGMQLGDWLAPGKDMHGWTASAKWTSTAYFANSAHIVSQAAAILGKTEDAAAYDSLFQTICQAFRDNFVEPDGHITDGFQSIYALALRFGLLLPEQRPRALQDLLDDIKARDNHLGTGFVGTAELLAALSDEGKTQEAYDLLFQDTCPSWLYPVSCGATSSWERWDSLCPDGTVNNSDDGPKDMVSFNHYAYGAVGNWLYTRVGGLSMAEPGYKTFRFAPVIGKQLEFVEVSHTCPYGTITCRWEKDSAAAHGYIMKFHVPEQTRAIVTCPDGVIREYEGGDYTIA